MSLLGIDVGSSSVKIGAYREDGQLIAVERKNLNPQHPNPGWWEQDPDEVWETTSLLIGKLMQQSKLRRDPPKALAISASVRENFPVDLNGNHLGLCIMAADVRGDQFEVPPTDVELPEAWSFNCGHLRERMDPFNRLLWWYQQNPEIVKQAAFFPGWHEFLSLRMCERAVVDPAIAGRWRVFNMKTHRWSLNIVDEFNIDPKFLPEILPWGTIIGEVRRDLVDGWNIPNPLYLAVGTSDLNSAALGAGVSALGDVCLVSGSFENMLIATSEYPTASMLLRGLSMTPHPGPVGRAVWAICPTGTAVLNWSTNLMGVSIEQIDQQLQQANLSPSSVLAVPYLSGAFIYWHEGRKLRGALFDLTLASGPLDIIRAFMESIAYDHVNTLSLLKDEGVVVDSIRAMGGGSRSRWWTQLKADMMGVPIEVISQPEPGTLGAAMLAGLAIGSITNLAGTSRSFAGISRSHVPDENRAQLHKEKMDQYRTVVELILNTH